MRPIHRLPPYRVLHTLRMDAQGQVVDWGLSLTGVTSAWKAARGAGVRVAVLDTGIDRDHPDLEGQLAVEPVDFTGSPFGADDRAGHGTHCAGIVAAVDNARGVIGVAPEARLLIGKVIGDYGSGSSAQVVAGIDWAIEQQADVLSLSLGSPQPDGEIRRAIQTARARGIAVVCAAGNSGPHNRQIAYPARWPETVAVAAINRRGELSQFSSRGDEVTIAAPGEAILSTYPGGQYATLSGTSMATPFIAGVLALGISANLAAGGLPLNGFGPEQWLAAHAQDAGPAGDDAGFGWGIIRVDDTLRGVEPTPPATTQAPIFHLPGANSAIYFPARAGDPLTVSIGPV